MLLRFAYFIIICIGPDPVGFPFAVITGKGPTLFT